MEEQIFSINEEQYKQMTDEKLIENIKKRWPNSIKLLNRKI